MPRLHSGCLLHRVVLVPLPSMSSTYPSFLRCHGRQSKRRDRHVPTSGSPCRKPPAFDRQMHPAWAALVHGAHWSAVACAQWAPPSRFCHAGASRSWVPGAVWRRAPVPWRYSARRASVGLIRVAPPAGRHSLEVSRSMGLLGAEGVHRVDPGRPARGQIAGEQRRREQHERGGRERQGVRRGHAEEQALEDAGRRGGGQQAEDRRRRRRARRPGARSGPRCRGAAPRGPPGPQSRAAAATRCS